jgi:hypothetical protein
MGWAGFVAVLHVAWLGRANGAVQEAVVAAVTVFWLVFGYALARAVDAITRPAN